MPIGNRLMHLLLGSGLALGLSLSTLPTTAEDAPAAETKEPIKVGVLHSLSGTMAISETTLKDTVLMLVE
jgi:urea transport system substrate-binding protein